MDRNRFIKNFALGGSILLTAPILFNSCSKDEMEEIENDPDNQNSDNTINLTDSKYSNLSTIGGWVYFNDIIVIRTSESMYNALSKICTHEGCNVSYNHSSNKLPCGCHGSVFDINGNVLNGPATKAIKKYTVSKSGNTLTIT